ncbi:MAG: DUF6134 family protein [Pseudomonadota bacterium]
MTANLFAPQIARSAALASRRFSIWRGGDALGFQSVDLRQDGDRLRVEIGIEIVVRVLGIAAYRYEMRNVELWRDARLQALQSQTNDDGTAHRLSVTRKGDQLSVEGTGFSGLVAGDAATTTYWSPAFLNRATWINTQDGAPLSVKAQLSGSQTLRLAGGTIEAERWSISGGLELALYYAGQEWVANRFSARGEEVLILAEDTRTPLAPYFSA